MEPRATEHIDRDRRDDRAAHRNGLRVRAPNGDVIYSPSRKFAGYGKLSGSNLDDLPRRARRGRRRRSAIRSISRCGKRRSPASRRGSPVGQAARLAHRVLRHGDAVLGETFDIHGGGDRPRCSRTTRTRSRRRCGATGANRSSSYWMHNGFAQHRQREDVEVARQLLHRARGVRETQASGSAALLPAFEPLPRADELFARSAGTGRGGAQSASIPPCAICRTRLHSSRRAASNAFHRSDGGRLQHA